MRTTRQLAAAVATAVLMAALPAAAVTIGFSGSFEEDFAELGDTLTVTNDPTSTELINQVVIDLSGSDANFDPGGYPFTILAGDPVGFDGVFDLSPNSLTLTLSFTDFNPGERFAFAVDVDDAGNSATRGKDFAGASMDVTFDFVMTVLSAFYDEDPANSGRAIVAALNTLPAPEPDSGSLLALGLLAMAAARRRRPTR